MKNNLSRMILGCFLLFIAINVSGCSLGLQLAVDSVDAKIQMDRKGETNSPINMVWEATQLACDELGIIVDSKNFDEKDSELGGHLGELDYIRIYLYKLTPSSTKVGVQARTALLPMTKNGYDRGFAKKIMDTISKILGEIAISSRHEDETYYSVEEKKLVSNQGEPVDIKKYTILPKGVINVYNLKWEVKNKQGSGQATLKSLGQRKLNGKNTTLIQCDLSNFVSGKKESSISFNVLDDTGYYRYAKQEDDMVDPKILEEPEYYFKSPCFVNGAWEDKIKTSLLRRKISVPVIATVEKTDDVIMVPAGTFENCLRIRTYCRVKNLQGVTITIDSYSWFAPGIGFVKSIHKEISSDSSLGNGGTMIQQLTSHTTP